MFEHTSAELIRWGLLTEDPGNLRSNAFEDHLIRLELFGFVNKQQMILWTRYYRTARIANLMNLILAHNNDFYPLTLVPDKPSVVLQAYYDIPNWRIDFEAAELLSVPPRERMLAESRLRSWLTKIGADVSLFFSGKEAEKIV